MHKPLFDLELADMQVVVDSTAIGSGMAWPTLFPLRYSARFDLKALEGEEGLPVTADRVAFNSKAPKKTRKTVGSWSGKLGKMSVSREKDEVEIIEYEDLRTLAAKSNDPAAAQNLLDMVFNDLKFCSEAMNARVELDALRIGSSGVFDGKVEYDGDMAKADSINFNVPSENFKGVGVAWSDADNADAIGDISAAQKALRKKGRKTANYVFLNLAKFEEICAQKATVKRLFPLTTDISLVTGEMVNLDSVNAYMRKNKYPQFVVIDSYVEVEGKDGETTAVEPWDGDVVVLGPTPNLGYTYYRPISLTENTAALEVQSSFFKTTRYSEVNPRLEVTMAEAYYQPALANRKSLVFINTTKKTWK